MVTSVGETAGERLILRRRWITILKYISTMMLEVIVKDMYHVPGSITSITIPSYPKNHVALIAALGPIDPTTIKIITTKLSIIIEG